MSDSLREQLLKTGLASEEDAKRAKAGKRRKGPKKKKAERRKQADDTIRDAKLYDQAKRERDRELNRQREAERQRQAEEKAARRMVLDAEIPHGQDRNSDVAFHFTYGERIKHIYVSPKHQKQLAAGELAIARTKGHFRLIPRDVAEKVKPKAPFLIAFLDEGAQENDPAYEEFPIPDDLMW